MLYYSYILGHRTTYIVIKSIKLVNGNIFSYTINDSVSVKYRSRRIKRDFTVPMLAIF